LAELQRELCAGRNAVNRTGVNLNQAIAALNSTGQPPVWLEHAVSRLVNAAPEVDTVVAHIHRRRPRATAGPACRAGAFGSRSGTYVRSP